MFIGILLSFNHRQGYCCDEVALLGLDRSLVLWRFQATGLTVGGRWVLQRWLSCSIDLSRTFFHVSIYLSIYLSICSCLFVHCILTNYFVYNGRSHRCRRKYYYSDQAGFHGTRLLETTKFIRDGAKTQFVSICDFSDMFFSRKNSYGWNRFEQLSNLYISPLIFDTMTVLFWSSLISTHRHNAILVESQV